MPAAFTLPRTPLGNFVRENYKGPGLQRRVFTKLKRKGFTPPAPERGTGGLTAAQRRELPLTFIGRTDVRGGYARAPRLNPNDYEVQQNRFGRFFAVPRSELTGLSPTALSTIKSFDQETRRTVPHLTQTYDNLRTTLQSDADATTTRLGNLGGLIQGSEVQADPGVANLDARLADARRGQETAASAAVVGQQSALPGYAAAERDRAVNAYQAQRAQGRTDLISGFREQQAEAEARQQELAAQLRGQDVNLLGTQLSQAGALDRALVSAGSRERVSTQELETRLLIAEIEGRVSEANSIRAALARQYSADVGAAARRASGGGNSGGGQRQKDTQEYLKDVRNRLVGQYVKNPRYKNPQLTPDEDPYIPKPGSQTSALDLVAEAQARGLKIVPVLNSIRAAIGSGFGRGNGTRDNPAGGPNSFGAQLLDTLLSGGMPRAQALKIVKQFTGLDLRPGAGANL